MARRLRSDGFLTKDERDFINTELEQIRSFIKEDEIPVPNGNKNRDSIKTKRNRLKTKIGEESAEDLKKTIDDWLLIASYLKESNDVRESRVKEKVLEISPDLIRFLNVWLTPEEFSEFIWPMIDPKLKWSPDLSEILSSMSLRFNKKVDDDFFRSYSEITEDNGTIRVLQPDLIIDPFRKYLDDVRFEDNTLEEKRKRAIDVVDDLYNSIQGSYFAPIKHGILLKNIKERKAPKDFLDDINDSNLVELYRTLLKHTCG